MKQKQKQKPFTKEEIKELEIAVQDFVRAQKSLDKLLNDLTQ